MFSRRKSVVCLTSGILIVALAWLSHAQVADDGSTTGERGAQAKETEMDERRVGFAVIYRWRVKPGMEAQYQQGWERVTKRLMADRGALGSRLHKTEDGMWVAYAQWPSRDVWERSRTMPPVDPEGSRLMQEAQAEVLSPILLEPVIDHLEPVPIRPGG